MKKYIGVDIGGTKCSVVLADEEMKILKKEKFPTEALNCTIEKIISIVADFAKGGDIIAAGISCGGPLDEKNGIILSPPNLPGWDSVCITDAVSSAANATAYLKNDADACAFAEWKFGAGKGAPT